MSIESPIPQVQASNGVVTPFSADRFAGTLLRAGVASSAAFQVAATVLGVLHGAAMTVVSTDALRAVAGEVLSSGGAPDPSTIHRLLTQASRPVQPALALYQVSVVLDGRPAERSDWGAVRVGYPSSSAMTYFNCAVDGRWIVQNAPLFPALDGGPVEVLFYFDLGVKPGFLVHSLRVAALLSPVATLQAPIAASVLPVIRVTEAYWTNFRDTPYPALGDPPSSYPGGRQPYVVFCRRDYPNQHCGTNECGPAAVSNSLQWLNSEYHLNIDPAKLTIAYWRDALGWDPGGVVHGEWADRKKKFVDDKNNALPIDSAKESRGHAKQVLDQFEGKNGSKTPQAVEVDIGSHVASVTCMGGPDDRGNYHLMASSDVAQGPLGGNPVNQQIVITPNGDVVSGPPWARGQSVNNFVIQCPHPGKF